MDPITIDLSSVAGIVAFTMTIVHFLKPRLGTVTYLQELPVWLYVIVVSGGLTWFAHDVLHKIEGDLPALALQSVMSALTASGFIEFWRTKGKAMADTKAAQEARDKKLRQAIGSLRSWLLPCVLALGLSSSACAVTAGLGPSAAAQQVKLSELARAVDAADRVLTIADTIQDVEIAAHDNQRVSDSAHTIVQQAFKEFAGVAKQGLTLAKDLSKPETTRFDAARSVGAIGFELIGRIEKYLPPEVAAYLTSLRLVVKTLGFSS
jgi:hypothetical protein